MAADPELGRCILCDEPMVVRRSVAREEPPLLCVACRRRSEAERLALREAAFARRTAGKCDAAAMTLRGPQAAAHWGVTARERDEKHRNALRARVTEALARAELARVEGARRLELAHRLMRRFDDLAAHAQELLRAAEVTVSGDRSDSPS